MSSWTFVRTFAIKTIKTMKTFLTCIICLVVGYQIWVKNPTTSDIRSSLVSLLNLNHFNTLEVRYNSTQIMENYRKTLFKDNKSRYLDPILEYYPYLLMEVKYTTSDNRTHESIILWDLTDGEMVTNTKNWEKTHGFGDCMSVDTTPQEFNILNVLIKKGGSSDKETLSKDLNINQNILDLWISSCQRKKLIIQTDDRYYLHFQNPRLKIIPETRTEGKLMTKSLKEIPRLQRRYSASQVKKIACAAFSQNFAIRKTTEVYLPVYSIVVQEPDGSTHTSYWNALNGKKISSLNFLK